MIIVIIIYLSDHVIQIYNYIPATRVTHEPTIRLAVA